MYLPPELVCLDHALPLVEREGEGQLPPRHLACPSGCRYPVVHGIPRCANTSRYASAFGLQWKVFQTTQLDSETGVPVSRNRLERCLGGTLDVARGKAVLEVGCGAGRFTELLLASGARVFACDLSEAVEANFANCSQWSGYFVAQADVLQLPVAQQSFDIVLCLGVIQHTPSPEQTIAALAEHVKPGGMLVIDHYTQGYPSTVPRRVMRAVLIRCSPSNAMSAVLLLGRILLPIHRLCWREGRLAARARRALGNLSPLVDYYDAYPELGRERLAEWAILDTYDTLTDRYKQLRTLEEITRTLEANGLASIEASYAGNGVEARARRPDFPFPIIA